MNDIWWLPSGEWAVYSDEEDIIRDFQSLAGMTPVATYYGPGGGRTGREYRMKDNSLLEYVCFMAGFTHALLCELVRWPGVSYRKKYSYNAYQPPLFLETPARRKK